MSSTEAEKMLLGLLNLYHKYTQDSDAMNKPALLKMMTENFPTFLMACERKSPNFFEKFFKKKDANHDEKINFSEFLSSVAAIATDLHNQSHGQIPF
ncbi:Protein S100-A7 [Tupaia chinensis]|uniref:Protein S100-A7 n=1 Tax=Tupaia chinensis TaxID=246437 RepID=L9JED1_TUPCH|nr:Protein S100-A7 [Tupaia chinensis]